ncbi:MAG TPA: hypothetical protein ENJ94_07625 [Gammaproteobacteria bacterium]|nr:hypothetical protein [Gammaproteobacteria bacterium]
MRYCLPLLILSLLAGCAGTVPPAIRIESGEPIGVAQAQADPEGLRGHRVRWGGEILQVINAPRHTDLVVLRRPLFDNGEPKPEGGEAKRFLARIGGFLDPADYRPGQRITVSGRLDGVQVLKVGEYPYPHPVVAVEQYHRWPKWQPVPEPPWHRDPFYCDPFWPWGGPRPWPDPYCW